jgi:hypothetical protein
MFARTDKAQAFRRWVLDVLDGVCRVMEQQETLTFGQQLALVRLSVSLMEKVRAAESLAVAQALYRDLQMVNKRRGVPTVRFSELAVGVRQRRLDEPDDTGG